MKQLRHALPLVAVFTIISAVVVAPFSYAVSTAQPNQSGLALEIAPPVLNLTANPGEVINTQIAIRDIANSPLIVTSEINDFTASGDENGNPKVLTNTDEKSPYSITNWVSPFPKMTLKSRQVENLPLKITVPLNAAPGGYYGVIRFTATAPEGTTSSVSLAPSLGALVMIRVKGDAYEKLAIAEFYMTDNGKKSTLFEGIPFDFVERIENQGNVYEQPSGNILIKNMFGKPVASVNVNSEYRNILPKSVRKFNQTFDKSALGNGMMFGRYTAELTLTYGNKQTVSSSLTFWVIPWKLIILGIVVLVGLVIGIRMAISRYNERLVGKSRRSRRR